MIVYHAIVIHVWYFGLLLRSSLYAALTALLAVGVPCSIYMYSDLDQFTHAASDRQSSTIHIRITLVKASRLFL